MNNDARYFFCLSGFVGFLLFFPLGWLVTGNALDALLRGCAGCLVFAVAGRALLGLLLRPPPLRARVASGSSPESPPAPQAAPPASPAAQSPEELAMEASARATNEAVSSSANALPQPGMEASA